MICSNCHKRFRKEQLVGILASKSDNELYGNSYFTLCPYCGPGFVEQYKQGNTYYVQNYVLLKRKEVNGL